MFLSKPLALLALTATVGASTIAVARLGAPSTVAPAAGSAAAAPDAFDAYDEFGFEPGKHTVEVARVRRNETLSDILRRHGASPADVAEIVAGASEVFDVRNIQAGRSYRVYSTDDRVYGLVYVPSSRRYVVFEPGSAKPVQVWNRPVLVERRTVVGTIESSLYETLLEQSADVDLAFELAEIFAWQIDFYHLLPGDSFTAIYDQRYVGGEPVGVGTVHAARFVNGDRAFSAYHFDAQGDIAYFDHEGSSLRKTFLAAPVKYSRISSRYTGRRFHPVLRRYRAHLGTDYAAPRGTPIRSTGDGEVVEAAYRGNNGRYVKIRHNGTYTTAYLHMSRIAPGITRGTWVRQGDIIGFVGSTGLARGNRVCDRCWKHGRQVDPLRETFPSAEPVSEDNLPAFVVARDAMAAQLDEVEFAATLPHYALLLK